MKKVLLINPPETEQSGFSGPPLGLLYLAGTLLKNGFTVEVIDGCLEGWAAVEKKICDFKPEIVGAPCLTPARQKSLQAARLAKQINKNILTVLGGAHATIMHRQILESSPFVDVCVLGEGEETLLEIARGKKLKEINGISFREDNKVILTPPRRYVENLDEVPFPAWHLIDLKKYPARGKGVVNGVDLAKEPRISVIFSRGCVGRCSFCSTWWIWRGWRHRSAKNMADELELLNRDFGISHFCFADDTLTVDRQATLELCEEIIKRKLKIAFHVTTRADRVDEEVLRKLRQAGCYQIAYGVETGSAALLKEIEKGVGPEVSRRAIELTKKAGIKTTALMIAGSLGETIKTINETVEFLRETRPDEVGSVGGLWVLPGTKVYFLAKKSGFIDDRFWLGKRPYKVYTLEHNRLTLFIFNLALKSKRPLSPFWVVNLVKATPTLLREAWLRIRQVIRNFFRLKSTPALLLKRRESAFIKED